MNRFRLKERSLLFLLFRAMVPVSRGRTVVVGILARHIAEQLLSPGANSRIRVMQGLVQGLACIETRGFRQCKEGKLPHLGCWILKGCHHCLFSSGPLSNERPK